MIGTQPQRTGSDKEQDGDRRGDGADDSRTPSGPTTLTLDALEHALFEAGRRLDRGGERGELIDGARQPSHQITAGPARLDVHER